VKRGLTPPIWGTCHEKINKTERRDVPITSLERFAFYERANKAYAVVSTGKVISEDGRVFLPLD